jgi:hypothetical protein
MNLNQLLIKFERWSTLVLLILFFVFMVSGYMITRGLIDRYWGLLLHTELDLPIMTVFTVHFAIRLRFYLLRKKIVKGLALSVLALLAGVFAFSFIVYLDLFYGLA